MSYNGNGRTDTKLVALTQSAGTLVVDWSLGNVFTVTLSESVTTLTFSNAKVGQKITMFVTQGGAGSFVVDWTDPPCEWPGGTAPTLSVAAGKIDVISILYDGTLYHADYSLDSV